jgi:paraquat-inducible protein B
MHLQLVSNSSGSVSVGSPILYRGYEVGQVEHIELDVESRRVLYSIFVDAPFDQLLSSNTRFWNSSGISAELNSEGIKVSMGSLQTALSGGVAFDLPKDSKEGRPIEGGMTFRLYPNESSIHEDPYRRSINYVVAFEQSLRGLHPGAPVTYRGIRIGSVIRIMLENLNAEPLETPGNPIPVLIKIEPGRMALEDSPEGEAIAKESIESAVDLGLRATLESGNLLTGAMFVELDFYEVDEPESLGEFADYPRIPAIAGGFSHLQVQISQLLDKLNELPIEGTLLTLEKAVEELRGTLVATRTLFENEGTQQLPMSLQTTLNNLNNVLEGFSTDSAFQSELNRTLVELKSTLQSVETVADQLAEKPNSLVFPTKQSADPEPKVAP